jgi:sulfur carrier protein ThiS
MVNDDIVPSQQAALEVHDSDEISLLPAIAGG